MLHNEGVGVAEDLFVTFKAWSKPGPNCSLEFVPDLNDWGGNLAMGMWYSTISRDHVKLPPEGWVQPFSLKLVFAPPYEKEFRVEILSGCTGGETFRHKIQLSPDRVREGVDQFLANISSGVSVDSARSSIDNLFSNPNVET